MEIPHTYLFTAYYETGIPGQIRQYDQGLDDKSLQDESKNAYYDIFYKPRLPLKDLFAFRLTEIGETEGVKSTIAVNLRSGLFEINGYSYFQHNAAMEPLKDFQLVYFKVNDLIRDVTYDKTTGESSTVDSYRVGYILGWQTNNAEGRKVERIVKI